VNLWGHYRPHRVAEQSPCRAGCPPRSCPRPAVPPPLPACQSPSSASRPAHRRPSVTRPRQCAQPHRHSWRPTSTDEKTPGAPPRSPALPPAGPTTTTRSGTGWVGQKLRRRPGAPRGCHTSGGGARQNSAPCTPATGAAFAPTDGGARYVREDRSRCSAGPLQRLTP
jgi:hypothetical protein